MGLLPLKLQALSWRYQKGQICLTFRHAYRIQADDVTGDQSRVILSRIKVPLDRANGDHLHTVQKHAWLVPI